MSPRCLRQLIAAPAEICPYRARREQTGRNFHFYALPELLGQRLRPLRAEPDIFLENSVRFRLRRRRRQLRDRLRHFNLRHHARPIVGELSGQNVRLSQLRKTESRRFLGHLLKPRRVATAAQVPVNVRSAKFRRRPLEFDHTIESSRPAENGRIELRRIIGCCDHDHPIGRGDSVQAVQQPRHRNPVEALRRRAIREVTVEILHDHDRRRMLVCPFEHLAQRIVIGITVTPVQRGRRQPAVGGNHPYQARLSIPRRPVQ